MHDFGDYTVLSWHFKADVTPETRDHEGTTP